MKKLKGFQKQYLKGLAHGLKPYVFIGQKDPGKRAVIVPDEKKSSGAKLTAS